MNTTEGDGFLHMLSDEAYELRPMDYPMHYFAAIQRRNQYNIQSVVQGAGLTAAEWRILVSLYESGTLSVNALSEVTSTERSKTSRNVAAMEKSGLIERKRQEKDKRNSSLALTEEGIATCRKVLPLIKNVYALNFKGLSEEDFNQLMKALMIIKDNVNRTEDYVGLRSKG